MIDSLSTLKVRLATPYWSLFSIRIQAKPDLQRNQKEAKTMKVVVTSRETLKPLRPTPHHLRRLQLSFLDQISNQNWVPWVYFYQSPPSGSILQLKKSLAETITQFYPLAGRVKDNLFVDCNDDGVDYFEAKADCQLSLVLAQPDNFDLNMLLPHYELADAGDQLFAIQLNVFQCGGIAIGTCFSHKIADALSAAIFVNSWAATARGDQTNIIFPKFDLATIFPPRDLSRYGTMSTGIATGKIKMKKFVFAAVTISGLKAKYASDMMNSNSGRIQPSRVEALTAFIWSRYVAATQGEAKGFSIVTQAVNLRSRMNPPLPPSCFGNLSRFAISSQSVGKSIDTTALELHCNLISQMRNAVRKVNGDYVKELQEGKTHLKSCEEPAAANQAAETVVLEVPMMVFSSTSTFPLYEADFGWGRPAYVSMTAQPFKNMIIFMPTSSGDGLEALINMEENDMAKLEADKEFLALVSPMLSCGHVRFVSPL